MKKTLLTAFCLSLLGGATAQADEAFATVIPDGAVQYMSPNGKYAVGNLMESMVVINIADGTTKTYAPEIDQTSGEYITPGEAYSSGLGNCISNTGIILASTRNVSNAAYLQNGEWKYLSTKGSYEGGDVLANGITPDGKRICGSIATFQMTMDNVTMNNPCYWELQENGEYSDPIILPHPEKDPLGQAPQYITANCISADGKVIAGQITDFHGFFQYPIVYIQDDKGEWSYKILGLDFYNQAGVEMPENPGDGPEEPNPADYMSPEARAEYEQAIKECQESGYTLPWPDALSYLTDEQLVAYNEAYEIFVPEAEIFNEKQEAYFEALAAYTESSPGFIFNNEFLTPDGKKYVVTNEIMGRGWWDPSSYEAWVIDIATGDCEIVGSDVNFLVTGVPNNDVILGTDPTTMDVEVQYEAFMVKNGEVSSLMDYLAAASPKVATWIDENMIHEVLAYVLDENGNPVYDEDGLPLTQVVDVMAMGYAQASEDMKTVSVWVPYPEWANDRMTEAAIFNLGQLNTGVGSVATADEAVAVSIYNMAGICVVNNAAPAAAAAAQLATGVYVVKTTYADGTVKSSKLVK